MTLTASDPTVFRLPLNHQRTWRIAESLPKASAYTQGALALSYPLPIGVEANPHPAGPVAVQHGSQRGGREGPESWAATFLQAVVEVIACDRPLTQLVRWTSRGVFTEIARRQQLVARHRGQGGSRSYRQHVATVRVCQPDAGCAEVSARLTLGARSRAVAARFDYARDRWVCTAICFG
jgi:hypothetical protein